LAPPECVCTTAALSHFGSARQARLWKMGWFEGDGLTAPNPKVRKHRCDRRVPPGAGSTRRRHSAGFRLRAEGRSASAEALGASATWSPPEYRRWPAEDRSHELKIRRREPKTRTSKITPPERLCHLPLYKISGAPHRSLFGGKMDEEKNYSFRGSSASFWFW
jgi:hypothetical protein